MRKRLAIAMVALVLVVLVIVLVPPLLLFPSDASQAAENALVMQTRSIVSNPDVLFLHRAPRATVTTGPTCCVPLLRDLGGYSTLSVNALADGRFAFSLPPPLSSATVSTSSLLAGQASVGTSGTTAYDIAPLILSPVQQRRVTPPLPPDEQAVLVATKAVSRPDYAETLLFGGVAALVIAGVLALWLSRRFARPLSKAVEVTERITGGELGATMPVASGDMPEFDALGAAINAMRDNLQRARQQQRHFLLSISHDLRTPLTSIKGYTEAIAEGAIDDVSGALDVISSEASRLDRLVNDLLDLARLDARRFSLKRTSVDVSELVRTTAARYQRAAGASRVQLVAHVPEGAPVQLITDRDRLVQLLSNLIENAFRFATREVSVTLSAGDGTAELAVVDDGPGISQEDLPQVFDPHFTTDRAGKAAGTGLGLAIVSELVAAMGGTVQAESPLTSSGGTRLVVRLLSLEPEESVVPVERAPQA